MKLKDKVLGVKTTDHVESKVINRNAAVLKEVCDLIEELQIEVIKLKEQINDNTTDNSLSNIHCSLGSNSHRDNPPE